MGCSWLQFSIDLYLRNLEWLYLLLSLMLDNDLNLTQNLAHVQRLWRSRGQGHGLTCSTVKLQWLEHRWFVLFFI